MKFKQLAEVMKGEGLNGEFEIVVRVDGEFAGIAEAEVSEYLEGPDPNPLVIALTLGERFTGWGNPFRWLPLATFEDTPSLPIRSFTIPWGASMLEFFAFPQHGCYFAVDIEEIDGTPVTRKANAVYCAAARKDGMPEFPCGEVDQYEGDLRQSLERFFDVKLPHIIRPNQQ